MSDLDIALRQRALEAVRMAIDESDQVRVLGLLDLAADFIATARGHALIAAGAALRDEAQQS